MTGLKLTSIVSHPAHPVEADVAGETVLMSLARSRCYGLGEIGTAIWKKLATPIQISDLASQLGQEYDAAPGIIERDVLELLQELAQEGLIEVRTPPEPTSPEAGD